MALRIWLPKPLQGPWSQRHDFNVRFDLRNFGAGEVVRWLLRHILAAKLSVDNIGIFVKATGFEVKVLYI